MVAGLERGRRLGAQGWEQILERQRVSGLSIQRFCQREGIAVSGFYRWRSQLGLQPQRLDRVARPRQAGTAGDFLDLGALLQSSTCEPAASAASAASAAGATGATGAPSLMLRLDLGGGVVLTLERR
jgi:hypothetical protein